MKNEEDIFDRFGKSSKKTLISSQQIAASMGQMIGPTHILLALSSVRGTIAFDILHNNYISPDQIRLIIGAKPGDATKIKGLSKEGKRVLKRAFVIAMNYKHFNIESEHLLLACIDNSKEICYSMLAQLGADPEKIKNQIINLFHDLKEMDSLINHKINQQNDILLADPQIANKTPVDESKKNKSTPALNYFTTDLVKLAAKHKLDKVIGRNAEILRTVQILGRRKKNNPILLGDPGVGKTAIVEGIAQLIACGRSPYKLSKMRILSLDMPLLVAGTMYRGQFEERVKKLTEEISKSKNIILFIDEIHTIVGAGSAEGSMDAANILKPALTKSRIKIIGATTYEEYKKFISKDAALERRFQPVNITEPTSDEAVEMILGTIDKYEKYHNVKISKDIIKQTVTLSNRYINNRFLPDKAIDILDEAASLATTKLPTNDALLENYDLKLDKIIIKKYEALKKEAYNVAYKLLQEEKEIKNKKNDSYKFSKNNPIDINIKDIYKIISMWSGIPYNELVIDDKKRLLNLEKILKKNIIGQDEAINEIANSIRRSKAGFGDESKPIGSFIFLGPTGVGKTELAKSLAYEVYGSRNALIKIDMSEFMERHNASRLLGAPPGYIGSDNASKLSESVRRNPYSVILFDEIEKAHPEFFNLLLQVLDEGSITDNQGNKIDFRNTIIIMTSNIGIKEIKTRKKVGFIHPESSEYENIKNTILKSFNQQLSPEFINRIDKIIVFKKLSKNDLINIINQKLNLLRKKIVTNLKLKFIVSPKVSSWLYNHIDEPEYGARPINRIIQHYIENVIAEKLLQDDIKPISTIKLDIQKNNIVCKMIKNA